eukprot:CAMPEP_0198126670 /NCGR_PEP_ID=MMETSP1442-20131203/45397_1 /TAXON_ID= /ORGANISM="Craspedostauros australis, Strain CCMP3328" /LENGTH=50 /DNA_ID=CAMNT_0043786495 /DNA_START=172 /DNA_END=324 /DNA_ORIENTATION=-
MAVAPVLVTIRTGRTGTGCVRPGCAYGRGKTERDGEASWALPHAVALLHA